MRKINSIWYGTRILAVCGLFLIAIPAVSYLLFTTFLRTAVMIAIIKVSMVIGGVILLIFCIILAIELQQDRRINLKYKQLRYRKILINNEVFECQNCGSRKAKREDTYCRECGVRFGKP
jgi:hypothetical protein